MLSYLGDVILNGNPEVKGKKAPELREAAVLPATPLTDIPDGTRQLLQKLGPEKFAAWAKKEKRLLITDTTFRDAHQSLMATRVRTHDLLATAGAIARRLPNLFSLEMWGGATFDTSLRFLHEDPWQRLRELRARVPNICFQMLLRGANAVGYASYPDNVIVEFVREAYQQGIDIFRIFDSLNSIDNMRVAIDAVLETGGNLRAGDLLHRRHPRRCAAEIFAEILRDDGEATGKTGRAFSRHQRYGRACASRMRRSNWSKTLRARNRDSDAFSHARHQRAQRGEYLESGGCRSGRGRCRDGGDEWRHQPAQSECDRRGSAAHAARHATGHRDVERVLGLLGNGAQSYYAPFDSAPKSGSARLYQHEIPGGQYTNLREQATAMGLGHRWREAEKMYADVNQLFGDIVKVTPSSKVVGDMTFFLMANEMSPADILALDEKHDISLPNSVVEMFSGVLGVPPGGLAEEIAENYFARAGAVKGTARREPGSGGFRERSEKRWRRK